MNKVQLKKFRDLLESKRAEIIKRAQQTLDEEGATDKKLTAGVAAADGRHLDREGSAEAIVDALVGHQDPGTAIELPVEISPVDVDE